MLGNYKAKVTTLEDQFTQKDNQFKKHFNTQDQLRVKTLVEYMLRDY